MNMNSKSYRWCGVPQCGNTSKKTPNKLFVFVPKKKITRDKWLKLARRDTTSVLPSTQLYFCEDHFDMPNDMENYMEYHLMGSVSQIRMKPGCMPTRYHCQSDRRKRTSDAPERSYILKKQRKTLIEECEKDLEERTVATEQVECGETSSGSANAETEPYTSVPTGSAMDTRENEHSSSYIRVKDMKNLLKSEPAMESESEIFTHTPLNKDSSTPDPHVTETNQIKIDQLHVEEETISRPSLTESETFSHTALNEDSSSQSSNVLETSRIKTEEMDIGEETISRPYISESETFSHTALNEDSSSQISNETETTETSHIKTDEMDIGEETMSRPYIPESATCSHTPLNRDSSTPQVTEPRHLEPDQEVTDKEKTSPTYLSDSDTLSCSTVDEDTYTHGSPETRHKELEELDIDAVLKQTKIKNYRGVLINEPITRKEKAETKIKLVARKEKAVAKKEKAETKIKLIARKEKAETKIKLIARKEKAETKINHRTRLEVCENIRHDHHYYISSKKTTRKKKSPTTYYSSGTQKDIIMLNKQVKRLISNVNKFKISLDLSEKNNKDTKQKMKSLKKNVADLKNIVDSLEELEEEEQPYAVMTRNKRKKMDIRKKK